jgi:hypothetical protein
MNNKQRTYSLDEIKDELIGTRGSSEREAYEYVRSSSYAYQREEFASLDFKRSELLQRARRHGIADAALEPFLASALFREHLFSYNAATGIITKDNR